MKPAMSWSPMILASWINFGPISITSNIPPNNSINRCYQDNQIQDYGVEVFECSFSSKIRAPKFFLVFHLEQNHASQQGFPSKLWSWELWLNDIQLTRGTNSIASSQMKILSQIILRDKGLCIYYTSLRWLTSPLGQSSASFSSFLIC